MKKSQTHASFLLFSTLCLLLFHACKKEDPQPKDCPPGLPCATQTGENTFGCYINGKPWVAEVDPHYQFSIITPKIDAWYDETGVNFDQDNELSLSLRRFSDSSQVSFYLDLDPVLNIDKFALHDPAKHLNIHAFLYNGHADLWRFGPEDLLDYNLEITKFDTVSNLIAGKISFSGIYKSDTIRVTNGRFDVKYYPK